MFAGTVYTTRASMGGQQVNMRPSLGRPNHGQPSWTHRAELLSFLQVLKSAQQVLHYIRYLVTKSTVILRSIP